MVFQHSTLFDSMTCVENVALPLRKHKGLSIKEALAEARRRLELVHMQEFADRYPAELGDGMRKRVAIARALTLDPRYVLFDEPTTSLDPVSARRVDALIRELSDKLGVTSIVVSHDLVSIFSIADRIVMLYKGKVRLLGTPDDFQALRRRRRPAVHPRRGHRADGPVARSDSDTHRPAWPRSGRSRSRSGPSSSSSLVILGGFILVMGGLSFEKTYTVYVDFDNPGGLQSGAAVRIAGVKVGSVKELEFQGGKIDPKTGRRVLVRAKVAIEQRVKDAIHDDADFYVTTQGVLGEQFMAIDPGTRRAAGARRRARS